MSGGLLVRMEEAGDAGRSGSKAGSLRLLMRGGLPVPEGFCLTADAYRGFLRRNGLDRAIPGTLRGTRDTAGGKSRAIRGMILECGVPEDVRGALEAAGIFSDPGRKWAVRSSSNLEDLQGASFAGLYDTFLDVAGMDEILLSVKKCWASLWSERAIAYREKTGLGHADASMAVILQEMVDAAYSGVLFTQKPHPFDPTKMCLEYCEGLGDRLVSGTVTPFACEIDRPAGAVRRLRAPGDGGLPDAGIRELHDLAVRIEELAGGPQDIEWAKGRDGFFILQARPIVRGNRRLPPGGIWTRANVGEVLPDVVTPLTWDVFRATLCDRVSWDEAALDRVAGERGIRRIRGRAYLRLDAFLDAFCYLPSVEPGSVARALGVRLAPEIGEYRRPTGTAVRLAGLLFAADSAGFLPRIRFLAKRLPPMPPPEIGRLPELLGWTTRCFRLHLKCTAYAMGSFARIGSLAERWLPGAAEELLPEILTGREDMQTSAQGITLAGLASRLKGDPSLREAFVEGKDWKDVERRLSGAPGGRAVLESLRSFLEANGARAGGEFELAVPRWREAPEFVLAVLRKLMASEAADPRSAYLSRRRRREAAVGRIASSLPPLRRALLSRLLSSHRDYVTCRENMKYRLMEGYEALRSVFLAVGRRMAAAGAVEREEDVFFLSASEVLAHAGGDGAAGTLRAEVAARRERHDRWREETAPDVVFGDGEEMPSRLPGEEMEGIGCSPGVAKGYARVLEDISGTDGLEPGEVLVAPHTDPGWTPLFLNCAAVVTEIGGFLSHGATVAREYGIPAVVNVPGATKRIGGGDLVEVDGTRGRVVILERAGGGAPAGEGNGGKAVTA